MVTSTLIKEAEEVLSFKKLKKDLVSKLDQEIGLDELAHNTTASKLLEAEINISDEISDIIKLYNTSETLDIYEVIEKNEPAQIVGSKINPVIEELEKKLNIKKSELISQININYDFNSCKKLQELYNQVLNSSTNHKEDQVSSNYYHYNSVVIMSTMQKVDKKIKEIKQSLFQFSKNWNNLNSEAKAQASELKEIRVDLEDYQDQMAKFLDPSDPRHSRVKFDYRWIELNSLCRANSVPKAFSLLREYIHEII